MGRLNTPLTIFSIYNSFAHVQDTAEKMCGYSKDECLFYDYNEYNYNEFMNYGSFYFKINNIILSESHNIRISIDKFEYKYYDELVMIFNSHKGWSFNISDYNHHLDNFYIIFKRRRSRGGVETHIYSVSGEGVMLIDDNFSRKIADYLYNDTICVLYKASRDLLATNQAPVLSKPPIFNPPATICYWTDGTKTVVKCQEGDPYSPEAGLALCYMKKILGNTSKDLNKELHKYISEFENLSEKEERDIPYGPLELFEKVCKCEEEIIKNWKL